MKLKTIIIFLFLLCLFSCKKKVDENYRPEFIGHWYCPYGGSQDWRYEITIDSNSHAKYQESHYGSISYTKEGTSRANSKHFKIGRTLSFEIIEYPHRIDTASTNIYMPPQNNIWKKPNWKMTLGKTLFHVGDGIYYKADY